jgi:uncharacterized membrane protein
MEKKRRSVIKAITWRITGSVDTILVSWLIIGRIDLALSIGIIEIITKMTLYYMHERAWSKIKFGLHKPTADDYLI